MSNTRIIMFIRYICLEFDNVGEAPVHFQRLLRDGFSDNKQLKGSVAAGNEAQRIVLDLITPEIRFFFKLAQERREDFVITSGSSSEASCTYNFNKSSRRRLGGRGASRLEGQPSAMDYC